MLMQPPELSILQELSKDSTQMTGLETVMSSKLEPLIEAGISKT